MTPLDSGTKIADDESDFEYFTSGKLFITHTDSWKMKKGGKKVVRCTMKIKLLLERARIM